MEGVSRSVKEEVFALWIFLMANRSRHEGEIPPPLERGDNRGFWPSAEPDQVFPFSASLSSGKTCFNLFSGKQVLIMRKKQPFLSPHTKDRLR